MPGTPIVLCLNAGSSSLKFSVWDDEKSVGEGEVEGIGRPEAFAWLQTPRAPPRRLPGQWADHGEATASVFTLLGEHALPAPAGVGHRLVHGGRRHVAPERVTPTLIAELRALIPLAPLHLPSGLAGVEAVAARFPALPQAVCFDTAFHRDLPEIARRLPLPRALADDGRHPALRLPRAVLRVRAGAAGRGWARPGGDRAPGQRGEHGGGARRAGGGHDHGVHPGGRIHDGHAHRRSRSGRAPLPDAGEGLRRPAPRPAGEQGVGPARRLRHERGHEDAAGAARARRGRRARGGDVRLPGAQADRRARGRAGRARHAGVHGRDRGAGGGGARGDLRRARAPGRPPRSGAERGPRGSAVSAPAGGCAVRVVATRRGPDDRAAQPGGPVRARARGDT